MEQNQPQSNTMVATQAIASKPNESYLIRLFAGRLNRQNYIVGSTLLGLIPLICFMAVIFNILLSPSSFQMPYLNPTNPNDIVMPQVSLIALLQTPFNKVLSAVGIVAIILSIPYLLSLQIRRLHDLNLNGWLWTINFLPLVSLYTVLPGINTNAGWLVVTNIASLIASLFSFYVTLWPGTKENNKYGSPPLPRNSFFSDILQIK